MQKYTPKLAGPFKEGDWPNLGCPVCEEGGLTIGLFEWEHQDGQKDHDDSPVDLAGRFYARLVCTRSGCAAWVVVSGDYTMDYSYDALTNFLDVWPMLTVRTIYPPVPIMDLTAAVPEPVRSAIGRASALVWLDPLAATGALRSSVERLMDELGIRVPPKTRDILHNRLLEFEKSEPVAGKLLLAAKYVGNGGAHESTRLTATDALETAAMIEVALGVLYTQDNTALLARADRIITAKRLVQ
ncbi:DUF4145 domain-containing protein [Nocardia tengchongensis]|uniref:DUF4145 domain-containing protein n=1 Tax=Nocardia tengchongensis TaxID=2055889 RepID=UPI00368BEFD7